MTNAEKLAVARAALETIKKRIERFSGEGSPTSLIHEEGRLQGIVDWYEQSERERIARGEVKIVAEAAKVPVS